MYRGRRSEAPTLDLLVGLAQLELFPAFLFEGLHDLRKGLAIGGQWLAVVVQEEKLLALVPDDENNVDGPVALP